MAGLAADLPGLVNQTHLQHIAQQVADGSICGPQATG
ncbi:Uncharacterised protein [Escherichia coli]|nr:Uncharacterised protein [Escherichia coli]SQT28582.1 Uncharacterised protein [Escherichia coli]